MPVDKNTIEFLSKIDLFDGLAVANLRRVAEIGEIKSFARNEKLFEEGDKADSFYVILEGAIRISRFVPGMGEEALAVLKPHAYFGEMALIDNEPRSATALAHESCKVFAIHSKQLEDLIFVDRDLAYDVLWNFVRTLSKRLRATNDKMTFFATANKF